MTQEEIKAFEAHLGYTFHNSDLLVNALTHSSYANENKGECDSNERLEFLGDSVLGFITAEFYFNHFKSQPEGDLTKMRAAMVCEKSLCGFSRQMQVGDFIRLGKGEMASGGRDRASILADAFEAILAAVYLDGGIAPAKAMVMRFVEPAVNQPKSFKDYKTMLQEVVQQNKEEVVEYVLVGETGPDHDKRFLVEVHINSNVMGSGEGRSKKLAEQEAARQALALMGL